ncbi:MULTISPECIES: SDR family oxidoreductase [unclassified Salinibacterium]|uniref:SDR family oxidoreductase n=1 Tax=unclassified Salinibacterium TaxID=2632331 RepID=UPI00141DBD8D|nr:MULTISPECIES: SDR family oxidoreductase [unclassified Salinibacterium]
MTILVTGTSGHLGRLVVESLLARGVAPSEIRAGARDTAKIADLAAAGVETVRLDYNDPASVQAAVDGADKVLLISGSEVGRRVAQHTAVIDAAVAAGVSQFVYTSAPHVDTSALVLAPEHKATEEAITASGLPATVLRNNWYTENYVREIEPARATGVLAASAGDGRVASASRADYAEAAAAVLTTDGHLGAVYELGGDDAWNYDELAAAIGAIVGREVIYERLTAEQHAERLQSFGLDAGTIGFVIALDANIREGALAETTGDLSRLIGRPTTPLIEGLRAAIAG